jgi:hypothetical protein
VIFAGLVIGAAVLWGIARPERPKVGPGELTPSAERRAEQATDNPGTHALPNVAAVPWSVPAFATSSADLAPASGLAVTGDATAIYKRFTAEAHLTPVQGAKLHHVFVELDRIRRAAGPPNVAEDEGATRYFAIVKRGLDQAEQVLTPPQRAAFRAQVAPVFPQVISAETEPFSDDDPEFQAIYQQFMQQFVRRP